MYKLNFGTVGLSVLMRSYCVNIDILHTSFLHISLDFLTNVRSTFIIPWKFFSRGMLLFERVSLLVLKIFEDKSGIFDKN